MQTLIGSLSQRSFSTKTTTSGGTRDPWIQDHLQPFPESQHMFKAKDLRLALIDIAVPRFLTKPPPSSTQDAQLPTSLAAKLLYSQEKPIPSNVEREEPTPKHTQEDLDKDSKVFYQEDSKDSLAPTHRHLFAAQISTSQEALNAPEAMVFNEKTLDLLALLTAHVWGDTSMVPIVP